MYLKEEEFLEEFLGTVKAALPLIVIYLRSSEWYVVLKIRFVGGKVTVQKRGDKLGDGEAASNTWRNQSGACNTINRRSSRAASRRPECK
jgi:hypothetical protein